MRVLEEDRRLKRLKLQLETPEDLYFASLLIDEGDLVTAWTFRQLKVDRGAGTERGDRVRVKLSVKVKKVEFQRFTDTLRVLGIIIEAPEWLEAKGSHHTIGLRPGDEVEIAKSSLLKHHERILQIASGQVRVKGVVSVDLDEVAAALLRPQGLEVLAVIPLPRPRKEGSLKAQVRENLESILPQLVAGLKSRHVDDLLLVAPRIVYDAIQELFKLFNVPVRFVEVSEGGLAGLHELMRRGDLRELLKESVLTASKLALEELVRRLGEDPDKVALGVEEVSRALLVRAVETLLVLDEALLSDSRAAILRLLESASETAREILVVPPSLEGAELLKRGGGVAALLYFDVPRALLKEEPHDNS